MLGYYDTSGRFCCAGRVGNEFSEGTLANLHRQLLNSTNDCAPFKEVPPAEHGASLMEPVVVVQVQFGGWTDEGRLCHPTFRVIRNDTLPPEVVLEVGHDNAEMVKVKIDHPPLRRTHPDTVLFPEPELTKLKLMVYYTEIAD